MLDSPNSNHSPAQATQGTQAPRVDQAIQELHGELTQQLAELPLDQRNLSLALGSSWSILRATGLKDFPSIRQLRAQDFASRVAPQHADAVSLALESIAWLSYASRDSTLDQAAQLLVRANALRPDDLSIAEKLAIVACELQPHHIRGFEDRPHKKDETAIGFVRSANQATERVLESRFGIDRAALTESDGSLLSECLKNLTPDEAGYVQRSLERLGQLFLREGAFFKRGLLLGLGIASVASHLQSLGLPRGIHDTVRLMRDALIRGSAVEELGENFDAVCSSLDVASAAYHLKWKIFSNHQAARISSHCDDLLEALATAKQGGAEAIRDPGH